MAAPAKLLLLIAPAINSAILAVVLFALDVGFWKSVIVALLSAIVSGAFLLVSTVIVVREARQNRDAIGQVRDEQRDVKAKLNANNRTTDK